MNTLKDDLLLYVVSDRTWLKDKTLYEVMQECIAGGATFLQLREKNLDYEYFVQEAISIQELARLHHIPFVVNDDIEVAIAANADGVHIGQSDGSVADARKRIGNDKILGVSALTLEQALQAQKEGADYVGVGSMFSTSTKADAQMVSYEVLKEICENVDIPVIAIGGIYDYNIQLLKDSGIVGVALVSAILAREDIKEATQMMKTACISMVSS